MSLPVLVAEEKWQEFDEAWNALIQGGGPIDDLLRALNQVAGKKRMPRCLPLLREHAAALAAAGRPADAARLLGAALLGGGAPGEIGDALYEHARAAWGGEPSWETFARVARFGPGGADLRAAWQAFERLTGFAPGDLVFHGAGWGTGEILAVDLAAEQLEVRFGSGRRDRFPLAAAIEIFEPLAPSDLRAQSFRDPAGLKRQLRSQPLEILRAVVERHDGRASTVAIKNALMHVGVEGGSWSAWWKKTRKLAESSPWFRVTGTTARGDVQLLLTAGDPVEDARRRYGDAPLAELMRHAREVLLGGAVEERLLAALVEMLAAKAAAPDEPERERLAAWIFIRERQGRTPEPLAEMLLRARAEPESADPLQPPPLWRLFHEVATVREQEACLALLAELFGEPGWIDEALANLHHAPPGMIRPLVERLLERRPAALGTAYVELLARPLRAPELLIALARMAEAGRIAGDFPPPHSRAQSLLALSTYLYVNRRSEPSMTRLQSRLVDFLTGGDPPVLRRMLADADFDALQSLQRSVQRGVDETIDNLVTELVMHKAPLAAEGRASFFWDNDQIWTTRAGRERRSAELKHLREVKIPQNEEALGRAAAMGDLSENFEWSSAIEEQRNLAQRKAQLEEELSHAALLEHAILPEDTVSPGTWVRYRDLLTGEIHRIEILGPWDTGAGEQIVSYRAPLAWGLLGKRVGEGAHIALPAGDFEFEVLEIGPLDVD